MEVVNSKRAAGMRSGVEGILAQIEWAATIVAAMVAISIILLSLASLFEAQFSYEGMARLLRVLCIGFSLSFASSAIGCILGFLFGIPKLLQKGEGALEAKPNDHGHGNERARPEKFFMTNTSFEEISDWLTKIIIGLGLVQFFNIVSFIRICSTISAMYVNGDTNNYDYLREEFHNVGAASFFFCLIVACLVLSCLFVYLETRTRITLLFLGMEAVAVGPTSEPSFAEALERPIVEMPDTGPTYDVGRTSVAQLRTKPLTKGDRFLLDYPRDNLTTGTQLAGWAAVQGRAGRLQVSEDALRDALQREPRNIQVMSRLAEIRRVKKNPNGFVETVIEAMKKVPVDKDVLSLAKDAQFEALYLPSPFGYEKAIDISNLLIKAGQEADSVVQLRLACALAQQYKFERRRGTADELAEKTREEALRVVRRVVELEPDPASAVRSEMHRLFVPSQGKIASEDDLEIFFDDPDFKAVIVGG